MLTLLLLLGTTLAQNITPVGRCRCGYYDAITHQTFTESIIVYFNETTELPQDVLSVQEYSHEKEKGSSAVYRQGARSENVKIGNSSTVPWLQYKVNPNSLELFVDPTTEDHLVVGAGVNSRRQDIIFGSFRARIQSPQPWTGGSALSMNLIFNESQSLELHALNADNASDAHLTYLVNGEYPDLLLSTNYTRIRDESTPPVSPWDFINVRIDWIEDAVNFTVANNVTRAITSKDREIPSTPSHQVFKHWSTGDANFMRGPPINRSATNIAWMRLFFNSSLMNAEGHRRFDAQCSKEEICNMDDITLRGSSSYAPQALIPYEEQPRNIKFRIPAAIVATIGASFGFVTLINALISRGSWDRFARLVKCRGRKRSLEKQPEVLSNSTSASNICEPELSFEPSSSASNGNHHNGSFDSDPDTDPLDSQGAARNASDIEVDISLANAENTKPSILDGMPSRGSVQLDISIRNSSIKQKISSLADHRASLFQCRTSLTERRESIATERNASVTAREAFLNGRRASLGQRIGAMVEHGTWQLAQRRASIAERKASMAERKASLYEQAIEELVTRIETQERRRSSGTDHARFGRQKSHSFSGMPSELVGKEPTIEINPKSFEILKIPAKEIMSQQREEARRVLFKIEQPSLINPDYVLRKDKLEQSGDLSNATSKVITPIMPPKKRVDYLAGLVALSCIIVTFVHFTLTFIPYVGGFGTGQHYSYEEWGRRIATPYFLGHTWIGLFFTTAARFLAQRYLQEGQLSNIANRTLLRAPRILIPVVIIAMIEYFMIDLGLTGSLQYLPSISWSTWPHVIKYPNFGYFINSMIELAFLIPNAAPQVVNHFCVGVLWTIPVQLQNSYLVLLGAVMVKDIKKPWKRLAFYTFCIVNHWYALSWGSFFWLGLAVADLDITYKWIKLLQARPVVHYPFLILMCIIAIAAPTFNLLQDPLGYPIISSERGWHPDHETGLPVAQTPRAGYPNYYEPRLNTLIFAGALQVIVELSAWVQWFLSLPVFTWLFPHIMTIYLIHGFVFWSLGAWLCVTLAVRGVPYWGNMLTVVIVSYSVLMLAAVLLTIITERPAQSVCRNMWRWASEEPIAKLSTLFPYPKDQFSNRTKNDHKDSQDTE
ncbi:hypothetical protein EPUS_05392 [Endocarpon pusillum Z07020]|uniref:GH16 domain-containing protein n=1 Tax=Endocarpon pusillum (strain Z07020 / HMAS-L-300199) TaxID=1263415 RepID=U1GNT8_ENDPU|nr:uncharacterized protein EPUS_05392 [Endocarpon pusillum Z07020]ERF73968.1 hypothetical protein EPUS_05392 [Endocarpon pusillum Z07020]